MTGYFGKTSTTDAKSITYELQNTRNSDIVWFPRAKVSQSIFTISMVASCSKGNSHCPHRYNLPSEGRLSSGPKRQQNQHIWTQPELKCKRLKQHNLSLRLSLLWTLSQLAMLWATHLQRSLMILRLNDL